jgi:hypothetical protein
MVQSVPNSGAAERKSRTAPPPQVQPLAYDIMGHCRATSTGRSTAYKAMNPNPDKRHGLPFLASFTVGKRRLILVEDSREWLAELRAASMAKTGKLEMAVPQDTNEAV